MKVRRNTLRLLKHYYNTENSEALLRSSSKLQVQSPNSIVARAYTARALFMTSKYSQAGEIFESIIKTFLGSPFLEKIDISGIEGLSNKIFVFNFISGDSRSSNEERGE